MTEDTRQCPFCERPAVLKQGTSRYRRGDRVISVTTQYWECPERCADPDGDTPFQFEDRQLAVSNDEAARRVWHDRFGVEMPARQRPGRKTPAPRRRRVPVLMSDAELAQLDAVRGEMSRGAFLREALERAISATGAGGSR